ncbi:hypothetical protein HY620_00730 [Candidatus Uhrbacteria bacterium]|nr:hypothetical protein [Candidatus Uhrbacteria bacterium]
MTNHDFYEQNRDFTKIPVQKISSFDPEIQPHVIPMYNHPARQGEDLENRVREIAEQRCWWLDNEFVEKKPREQFEFLVNGESFSVYNYGNPLTREETQSIQRVVSIYSQIADGRVLKTARSIVINNTDRQDITVLRGGNQNGRVHPGAMDQELLTQKYKLKKAISKEMLFSVPRMVEINPQARLNSGIKGAGTPNSTAFEGDLVHELGHVLDDMLNIRSQWNSGWRGEEFDKDNPPPTSYGRLNEAEDIAESIRIFLLNPLFAKGRRERGYGNLAQKWEQGRATLLKQLLGDPSKIKALKIPMEKRTGNTIQMPAVPKRIEYVLVREQGHTPENQPSSIRSIRKITNSDRDINEVRTALHALQQEQHGQAQPISRQQHQKQSEKNGFMDGVRQYIRSLFVWRD